MHCLLQLQTLCLAIVVPRPLVLDSPPSVNKKPAGLSLQARGALHPKGSAPILLQQNQVRPSLALNHINYVRLLHNCTELLT